MNSSAAIMGRRRVSDRWFKRPGGAQEELRGRTDLSHRILEEKLIAIGSIRVAQGLSSSVQRRNPGQVIEILERES